MASNQCTGHNIRASINTMFHTPPATAGSAGAIEEQTQIGPRRGGLDDNMAAPVNTMLATPPATGSSAGLYKERPPSPETHPKPKVDEEQDDIDETPLRQVAERRAIPPFHFSPRKGSLHERRRSRSFSPKKGDQAMVSTTQVISSPTQATYTPVKIKRPRYDHAIAVKPVRHSQFNIFKALLKHQDLILALTGQLPLKDFISLYAISKEFHYLLNRNATAFMKHYARVNAPGCDKIFQFRFYPRLVIQDPIQRPLDTRPSHCRIVPGFRWLTMVVFRHEVVQEIIKILEADGHRMPALAHVSIKKIWFLLDIPTNERRLRVIHTKAIFEDVDLFRAALFFVKLDMLFSDPFVGSGRETCLRKQLLDQRSLSTLWRTLRREQVQTVLDVLQLHMETDYRPIPLSDADNAALMGLPAWQVGRRMNEKWGERGLTPKLIRPDELIWKEQIRRELNLQKYILAMMDFGTEFQFNILAFKGYENAKKEMQQKRTRQVKKEAKIRFDVARAHSRQRMALREKGIIVPEDPEVKKAREKMEQRMEKLRVAATIAGDLLNGQESDDSSGIVDDGSDAEDVTRSAEGSPEDDNDDSSSLVYDFHQVEDEDGALEDELEEMEDDLVGDSSSGMEIDLPETPPSTSPEPDSGFYSTGLLIDEMLNLPGVHDDVPDIGDGPKTA
ncbi:MAG: hypothetical protein M1820_001676 [Bogoriella megaspora]|nr:MAG: hypothetical protein M1820_001676 [Bogoriella megaspora]